jgi:DNA modification methylase
MVRSADPTRIAEGYLERFPGWWRIRVIVILKNALNQDIVAEATMPQMRYPFRMEKRPRSSQPFKKPPLRLQPTTLWDYPSQHYGDGVQGDPNYKGATPSYIIWNLLQRYTKPKDLVIDPCAGSGTTLDVARELDRRALGYDVHPTRKDIFRVDARKLPPELTGKVDFVFIDPPYSTHLDYGPDPRDIGKLDAADGKYYAAMEEVIAEIHRVLKPGAHMALYVSDSFVKGKGFYPIGFELFARLQKKLTPVDIVTVTRHNKTLEMGNYRKAAEEGNFFLRGFNYLFIMKKLET